MDCNSLPKLPASPTATRMAMRAANLATRTRGSLKPNLSASAGRAYERPRPRARRKPPWMPLVAPSRRLPSQVSGSCPLAARLAARYRQGLTPILRYPHPSLLRCRGAVSRATLQGMTHHSFLVAPPRDLASHQQPHSPIRIMRGVSAVLGMDPTNADPWEIWEAITHARMHAVNVSHKQPPLFVGQSCLRLAGIHGWSQNPPITIFRASRRSTTRLPSCTLCSTTVPATSVSCSPFPPLSRERATIDGLTTEHPYDALLRCALHDESLEAFVLGSMALQSWSHFSMFQQDDRRRRAEQIRNELLMRLTQVGNVRGYRRARSIVHAIDPGCANPAEAALLWIVRSICPFAVATQARIDVRGRHYYVDILIEQLHIIIEFDGITKLGTTRAEIERAKREWVLRDQDLRDAGWQVIRVSWTDYDDWERLRIRLIRALGPMKPAPEFRSLWKLHSTRCDGPSRRFYTHGSRRGYEHADRL